MGKHHFCDRRMLDVARVVNMPVFALESLWLQ